MIGKAQHGETLLASTARRTAHSESPACLLPQVQHVMGQACGIQGHTALRPCCQGQQCTHGGSAQQDICPRVDSTMFQKRLKVFASTQ